MVEKRGEEETKSMPHAPVTRMPHSVSAMRIHDQRRLYQYIKEMRTVLLALRHLRQELKYTSVIFARGVMAYIFLINN